MIRRICMALLMAVSLHLEAADSDSRDAAVAANPDVVNNEGYLEAHPDQGWRAHAVRALRDGRTESALTYLQRAARYADKPSQALLAALLWEGKGTIARDRPSAYAWMDLAAERGYPGYLATRESYWSQLDETERRRAVELGSAIYDEYADAVAQPRLNQVLRRTRGQMTGSRVGFVGPMTVIPTRSSGFASLSGDMFYDARHWDPKRYWQAQDALWNPLPQGRVEVGAPRPDATPVQP